MERKKKSGCLHRSIFTYYVKWEYILSLLRLVHSVSFIFFSNIWLSQIKTDISSPTLDICKIIDFGGKHIKLWTQSQAEKEMDSENFCISGLLLLKSTLEIATWGWIL